MKHLKSGIVILFLIVSIAVAAVLFVWKQNLEKYTTGIEESDNNITHKQLKNALNDTKEVKVKLAYRVGFWKVTQEEADTASSGCKKLIVRIVTDADEATVFTLKAAGTNAFRIFLDESEPGYVHIGNSSSPCPNFAYLQSSETSASIFTIANTLKMGSAVIYPAAIHGAQSALYLLSTDMPLTQRVGKNNDPNKFLIVHAVDLTASTEGGAADGPVADAPADSPTPAPSPPAAPIELDSEALRQNSERYFAAQQEQWDRAEPLRSDLDKLRMKMEGVNLEEGTNKNIDELPMIADRFISELQVILDRNMSLQPDTRQLHLNLHFLTKLKYNHDLFVRIVALLQNTTNEDLIMFRKALSNRMATTFNNFLFTAHDEKNRLEYLENVTPKTLADLSMYNVALRSATQGNAGVQAQASDLNACIEACKASDTCQSIYFTMKNETPDCYMNPVFYSSGVAANSVTRKFTDDLGITGNITKPSLITDIRDMENGLEWYFNEAAMMNSGEPNTPVLSDVVSAIDTYKNKYIELEAVYRPKYLQSLQTKLTAVSTRKNALALLHGLLNSESLCGMTDRCGSGSSTPEHQFKMAISNTIRELVRDQAIIGRETQGLLYDQLKVKGTPLTSLTQNRDYNYQNYYQSETINSWMTSSNVNNFDECYNTCRSDSSCYSIQYTTGSNLCKRGRHPLSIDELYRITPDFPDTLTVDAKPFFVLDGTYQQRVGYGYHEFTWVGRTRQYPIRPLKQGETCDFILNNKNPLPVPDRIAIITNGSKFSMVNDSFRILGLQIFKVSMTCNDSNYSDTDIPSIKIVMDADYVKAVQEASSK